MALTFDNIREYDTPEYCYDGMNIWGSIIATRELLLEDVITCREAELRDIMESRNVVLKDIVHEATVVH